MTRRMQIEAERLLEQHGELTCNEPLSIGRCAELACLLEASAPKPGNVHPQASFADLDYSDFVASAEAIVPAMDAAARGARLGDVVLQAVEATRQAAGTNTNLGAVLLLAPLAMIPGGPCSRDGLAGVLRDLDAADAAGVYQAIRTAQPGGLGEVDEADVRAAPPEDLLAAMRLAADRDLVARQYVNQFEQVFAVADALQASLATGRTLCDAIVRAHVWLMAREPDSLIARKCGLATAQQSARRAADVLAHDGDPAAWPAALAEFDAWLRSDGHRRNPGTTADLIAAGLFALIRSSLRFD